MYPGYYWGIIRVKNVLDLGWVLCFLSARGMFGNWTRTSLVLV